MAYNVKQIQEKKNCFHKAEYTLEINENGKNKTSAPKKKIKKEKKKNWVLMGRKGNLKKWSFQTKPN